MEIRIKVLFFVAAGLIAMGWSQTILAQSPLATTANTAVQITEARKANALFMRQYSWTSRTELIEEGQVKDTRIEQVSYGFDGQLQRILLNDTSAPLPRGFLRRSIAEQKRQEVEQYLTGLRSLLDHYTLETAGKVLDFMSQAVTTEPDASGMMVMTGSNVVVSGDSLTIWTLAATKQTRKVQANTFYLGNVVEVTATFNTLPTGLNYMAYAEATIPAKQMSVQLQNFDYNRTTAVPPTQAMAPIPVPTTAPVPAPTMAAPSLPGTGSLQSIEQKLKDLKSLFDQGLISQSDYEAKKAQLLQGL